MTFAGTTPTSLPDIYYKDLKDKKNTKTIQITNNNAKHSHWDLGQVESITWKSHDGTEIEGVLHKPSSFDPNKNTTGNKKDSVQKTNSSKEEMDKKIKEKQEDFNRMQLSEEEQQKKEKQAKSGSDNSGKAKYPNNQLYPYLII